MADISGHARSTSDIVERERGDKRIELHEEGKGLSNAAGGSKNGDLAFWLGFHAVRSAE